MNIGFGFGWSSPRKWESRASLLVWGESQQIGHSPHFWRRPDALNRPRRARGKCDELQTPQNFNIQPNGSNQSITYRRVRCPRRAFLFAKIIASDDGLIENSQKSASCQLVTSDHWIIGFSLHFIILLLTTQSSFLRISFQTGHNSLILTWTSHYWNRHSTNLLKRNNRDLYSHILYLHL